MLLRNIYKGTLFLQDLWDQHYFQKGLITGKAGVERIDQRLLRQRKLQKSMQKPIKSRIMLLRT